MKFSNEIEHDRKALDNERKIIEIRLQDSLITDEFNKMKRPIAEECKHT